MSSTDWTEELNFFVDVCLKPLIQQELQAAYLLKDVELQRRPHLIHQRQQQALQHIKDRLLNTGNCV